jgi:hypothetical protein
MHNYKLFSTTCIIFDYKYMMVRQSTFDKKNVIDVTTLQHWFLNRSSSEIIYFNPDL